MTELQAEIILALADNDLIVSKTARNTNYHRNSLDYHIKRIKDETGLDPLCFWDMVNELVPKAERTLTYKTVHESMRKIIEQER